MDEQRFSLYLPLQKVEEAPDGALMVWGRATQEVVDNSGEIMDFESSVPLFKQRSKEISDRSGGENMFPLRAMHQPIAAGKVVELMYDEASKAIDICAKVVDANEANKVRQRVYTGFSVGGRYAKRWRDASNSQFVRFTADPLEISLVDAPAVPTARLTLFKVDDEPTPASTEFPQDAPEWVTEFIKSVRTLEEMRKADEDGRVAKEDRLKALGGRAGIARREGAPLEAPKGYPDEPSEYGDPANWAFPCDKAQVVNAVSRFNGGIGEDQYSSRERNVLGRRISRLASRFGSRYVYNPEVKKIMRKDDAMTTGNEVAKLDVGGLLAQLKAANSAAADMVAKDPEAAKDALSALMGRMDELCDMSTPVSVDSPKAPVSDPSHVVKKADSKSEETEETEETEESKGKEKGKKPAFLQAKKAADPAAEEADEEVKKAAEEEKDPPAKKADEVPDVPEAIKAQMAAQDKQIATLTEGLDKAVKMLQARADADSGGPVGDLNAIVEKGKAGPTQNAIIKALMDGGPYALIKALKAAGSEDEIDGPMAWTNMNNAIREASYAFLEQGGIVTAKRYQGKIWNPPA